MQIVQIQDIKVGQGNKLALIAGPCVIESESIVMQTAEQVKKITDRLEIPLIFKSSFLKDNRSSSQTYQGAGMDEGLKILQKVKNTFSIPVLSDIHYPWILFLT